MLFRSNTYCHSGCGGDDADVSCNYSGGDDGKQVKCEGGCDDSRADANCGCHCGDVGSNAYTILAALTTAVLVHSFAAPSAT